MATYGSISRMKMAVTGGLVSNGRWPEIDWWTADLSAGMLDILYRC